MKQVRLVNSIRKQCIVVLATIIFSCSSDESGDIIPDGELTIGGTISNNPGEVTLSLNGIEQNFAGSNFLFDLRLKEGDLYLVQFISSSTGQTCTINNGVGTANANVNDIEVVCSSSLSNVIRFVDVSVTGNLVIGDMNGDGHQDLIFSIRTLPGFPSGADQFLTRIMYGDGVGNFGSMVDITGFGEPRLTKRGGYYLSTDLNEDNIDDFVYTGDALIEAYAGATNGQSTALFNTSEYGGEPILSFDADGNGFKDILSITLGGSNINFFGLFKNSGSSLSPVSYIGTTLDDEPKALGIGQISNFTAADFNNNGHTDILAIITTTDINDDDRLALGLFSGQGDGTFNYPDELQLLPTQLHLGEFIFDIVSKEIATGDFDEDGDTDIAITSTNTILQLLTNDGSGVFTATEAITVGTAPIHIRVADFDQDAHLDLVSVNDETHNLTLVYGAGDGTFDRTETIQMDGDIDFYDIAIAHLDNNNFPDIAIGEQGTNPADFGRGSIQIIFNPGQ